MKALITLILTAFVATMSMAQEKNIETESVELGNLISFIVNKYDEDSDSKSITFLIQANNDAME